LLPISTFIRCQSSHGWSFRLRSPPFTNITNAKTIGRKKAWREGALCRA